MAQSPYSTLMNLFRPLNLNGRRFAGKGRAQYDFKCDVRSFGAWCISVFSLTNCNCRPTADGIKTTMMLATASQDAVGPSGSCMRRSLMCFAAHNFAQDLTGTTIDLKPIEMSWQGELDLMQLPPPPLLLLLPLRN